jgi:uncharacterized protein (DUF58 family)
VAGLRRLPALPIVPTARAGWAVAALAPLALVIAAAAPGAWGLAPAIALVLLALIVADGMLAGACREWRIAVARECEVGQPLCLAVVADIASARAEAAIECDPRLSAEGRVSLRLARSDVAAGDDELSGNITLTPTRRGTAALTRLWLRWQGPMGLGARQITCPLEHTIAIFPDLSPVRSRELQAFLRDAQSGLVARRLRGEGTQFEALSEYEAGMDRRRIDWKASARHIRLYARENEAERNNQIVFALDCGQAMCEAIDGQPRLDRAVSAALTCAYVALKGGDKCALFGFARTPLVMTPFVADPRSFHRLQSAAASLDYHSEDANFTLALARLTTQLKRRSLIVLFSDFSDPAAAELMIESIGRLITRHLVIFVTLADSDLEHFIAAEPGDLATLARSIAADSLAQQRSVVLQRLRHMGVDVIEAPWEQIGFALIDRYLAVRNAEAIG